MADTIRLPVGVDVAELRRDLESVEVGLDKLVTEALREAGTTVVRATPPFAPFDPDHDFKRKDGLPHLRETFSARVLGGRTATIGTTHPGGQVHEYGGTIAPRTHGVTRQGADIKIKPSRMAHKAADKVAPQLEQDLARRLQRLVREHNL